MEILLGLVFMVVIVIALWGAVLTVGDRQREFEKRKKEKDD